MKIGNSTAGNLAIQVNLKIGNQFDDNNVSSELNRNLRNQLRGQVNNQVCNQIWNQILNKIDLIRNIEK